MPIEFSNRPKCTICGEERREANHWFVLVIGCMSRGLYFETWNDQLAIQADGAVCGEACAHKALSRWLETGTLEAPTLRSETHEVQTEMRTA
jgi:hypothetical protein